MGGKGSISPSTPLPACRPLVDDRAKLRSRQIGIAFAVFLMELSSVFPTSKLGEYFTVLGAMARYLIGRISCSRFRAPPPQDSAAPLTAMDNLRMWHSLNAATLAPGN